jgi:hypothetical protein
MVKDNLNRKISSLDDNLQTRKLTSDMEELRRDRRGWRNRPSTVGGIINDSMLDDDASVGIVKIWCHFVGACWRG